MDYETRAYLKQQVNLARRRVIGIASNSKATSRYTFHRTPIPLDLLPTATCPYCGNQFERQHTRHFICSRRECQTAHNRGYRQRVRERYERSRDRSDDDVASREEGGDDRPSKL